MKHFTKARILKVVAWALVLSAVCTWAYCDYAYNRKPRWMRTIFADKAGYNMYLPATIIYQWDTSKLPENAVYDCGRGFKVNEEGKFATVYTCGVALMQAPFFLIAHATTPKSEATGFTTNYDLAVVYASATYFTLGMYFLYGFLRRRFRVWTVVFTLFGIGLLTNLMYYTMRDAGMSHVYSFCLYSAFLYFRASFEHQEIGLRRSAVVLGLIAGLIILIRPTGLLFLVAALFLTKDLKGDLQRIIQPRFLFPFLICAFLVFIPQMMYWKYLSGSFISYSYKEHTFIHWLSPKLGEVLFAPNNGLLTYTPAFMIIFLGMYWLIRRNKTYGWTVFGCFVILCYLSASWYSPGFGCAYGARNFTEYYALFSIPLAVFFERVFRKSVNNILKGGIVVLLVTLATINIRAFTYWRFCFFGKTVWDWDRYNEVMIDIDP